MVPKHHSISRLGYALSDNNELFGQITHSEAVQEVTREIGMRDPVVLDSIAVLKPPRVGGMINIHQDSTFLVS